MKVTDEAWHQIATLINDEESLRVYVMGGGCAGFQYGMVLDEERPGDTVLEGWDGKVLIDKQSAPYLDKVTLDWVVKLEGSFFNWTNEAATGSCGCGQSFGC